MEEQVAILVVYQAGPSLILKGERQSGNTTRYSTQYQIVSRKGLNILLQAGRLGGPSVLDTREESALDNRLPYSGRKLLWNVHWC